MPESWISKLKLGNTGILPVAVWSQVTSYVWQQPDREVQNHKQVQSQKQAGFGNMLAVRYQFRRQNYGQTYKLGSITQMSSRLSGTCNAGIRAEDNPPMRVGRSQV